MTICDKAKKVPLKTPYSGWKVPLTKGTKEERPSRESDFEHVEFLIIKGINVAMPTLQEQNLLLLDLSEQCS